MSVGENIKKFRLEKGWTQRKLGEECEPNIAESTIRRYELGKLNPKLETLQKIATALKVPVSELDDRAKSSLNIQVRDQDGNIQTKQIDISKLQQLFYQATAPSQDMVEKIAQDVLRRLEQQHQENLENWSEGQHIKQLRVERGLSQIELAQKAGIPQGRISEYENNNSIEIPIIDIHRIASALNVTSTDITGLDDPIFTLEDFLSKIGWGILEHSKAHYIIFKDEKYYSMSKLEYETMESCILPYLYLGVKELISSKKPLNRKELKQMGLDWLAEP